MSTFEVLDSYVSLRRRIALLRAASSKDLELGHNQVSILYRLLLSTATMGDLAAYAATDKASISRTVSSLEKEGFIKRAQSKEDRRVIYIELTVKGRNHALAAQKIRNSIGKKVEHALTAAEKKQFAFLTKKITDHLDHLNEESE
jgi:MarR family transcriptional regulator, 2-MHQ and catechol-resistance regulon repressor